MKIIDHVTRHSGRDAFLPQERPPFGSQINSRFLDFSLTFISLSICRYPLSLHSSFLLHFSSDSWLVLLFLSFVEGLVLPYPLSVRSTSSTSPLPRKKTIPAAIPRLRLSPAIHSHLPVTPRVSHSPHPLYIHIIYTNEATSSKTLRGLRPLRSAAVPWHAGCAVAPKHRE